MDDLTTIIEHEVITILLHLHQNHGGLQRFYANLLASVGDVRVSVCVCVMCSLQMAVVAVES